MNDEPLSQAIDPIDLTAAQVVAVNGALKPKRKRKASPKPQQEAKPRKARKTVDPLLAEQQASKASATPHIASLTEGVQPFEARPAVVSPDAAGPSHHDREARYIASVFDPNTAPRPDLAPPAPSKWWQRFVAPFVAVERGVVSEGDDALVIAPAPVFADLSRGDVQAIGVIVAGVLALGVMLAVW